MILALGKETYTKEEIVTLLEDTAIQEMNYNYLRDMRDTTTDTPRFKILMNNEYKNVS